MQFLELEPLLVEAADAMAEAGSRMGIGRIAARAATALEHATPLGVSAAVAASSYAVQDTMNKAKRIKRMFDDRFRPKRLLEDFEQSLLPAHKKSRTQASSASGMPRRPAKPAKRLKRASSKKGTTKRRTSTKKKAKAARKKVAAIRKNVVHKQQPHGSGERDDVFYMGFQHHGGRDEVLEVVVDSILRKYLLKFGISVDNPDTCIPVDATTPSMSKARIVYRSTDFDSGAIGNYVLGQTIDFDIVQYQNVVGLVALEIKTQARLGNFPVLAEFQNNVGSPIYKDRRLNDAIIQVTCSGMIKLRNITPNDSAAVDGTTAGDRFALDTNPLQGKMYTFSGDIPIVKNVLRDPESDSNAGTIAQIKDGFAKWMDAFRSKGICGQNIDSTFDPQLKADQILSTPPVGSKVFDNCRKTTNIVLAPGGSAVHKTAFSYKGTLDKFIRNCVGNGVTDYTKLGGCTWFGLEQMYSSKGEIGAGHDKIRMEYDVHNTLRCGCRLKAPEKSPATVDTNALNF